MPQTDEVHREEGNTMFRGDIGALPIGAATTQPAAGSSLHRIQGGRPVSPADRAAVLLVVLSGVATVLGRFSPDGMGMVPLLGGLTLLLIGALRREALTAGFLLLLMLTLRIHLRGDERYFPQEIALTDYILVLIAVAATFRASRDFWRYFQILLVPSLTAAGVGAWITHLLSSSGAPFVAGILTGPQTSFVFGVCFCLSIGHLNSLARGHRHWPPQLTLPMFWLLMSLLDATLILASDGPRSLLLAGISLLLVSLSGRKRPPSVPAGSRSPLKGWLLVAALLLGATAALIPGGFSPASLSAGVGGLSQRLDLLRCFFLASFERSYRFLYGLGFTNSSTWLCRDVRPGSTMIQADNLLAQVAADNGILTMLVLVFLLFLLLRQGWRLRERLADPVLRSSLTAGLYTLLFLQADAGWGRTIFLQALLGFQLAAFTLLPDPRIARFAGGPGEPQQ